VWLLLGTIAVNSVLAPLIAIGICHLFPLDAQARTGLEIVTIAAAGPAGMKAAQFTKRGDIAMALSFTIVLQLVNIVAAPLWARAIISGATVSVWSIVGDLLLLVLAPLVVGQVLRARYSEHADRWKAELEKVSNLALVVALAVGMAVNWSRLVSSLGSWVIVSSCVLAIAFTAAGWVVGLGDRRSAVTISMVSSMRFTPIGLVVIASVLHNQGAYLTPALIFALMDTVIPFAIALELGRRAHRQSARPASAVVPAPRVRSVT
jgi:BASS family bile acid:Na+ symporter